MYGGVRALTATVLVSSHFPTSQNSFQLCFTTVCFEGLQASGTGGFVQCFLKQETGTQSSLSIQQTAPPLHVLCDNLLSFWKTSAVLEQSKNSPQLNREHLNPIYGLTIPAYL